MVQEGGCLNSGGLEEEEEDIDRWKVAGNGEEEEEEG